MQSEAIRRCIGSSFGDVDVVVGSAEAGSARDGVGRESGR